MVDDLCEALGYFGAFADARGVLQAVPYIAPGDRAPTVTLTEAEDGVRILPRVKITSQQWDPVNRWTVWRRATETLAPILATAVNNDPLHPYSTVNLGYIRDAEPVRDLDVNPLLLPAYAERVKAEAMADQLTFSLKARFHPIDDHEVASIHSQTAGLHGVRAAVAQREIDCVTGEPMRLLLREVR